ncbi:phage Gp37/Gp68 family protein [Aestuariivirga litoralis]|uniref:phage Gp37/Gp68 family protein n=1 Tax=Aestuariivirga litoralis TaxID=2650924 RepID=UPI0018C6D3DF|nr:phage Gp37/Gp68 family protein [Aestuariivirga litoralis]
MGDKSGIEWTDATWNPIVGCSIVSPGCTNCYAMRMAYRLDAIAQDHGKPAAGIYHYLGTTQQSRGGPVWTGKLAIAPDKIFNQPLRWKKPRRVFVNSMGDLFHEFVPDEAIDRVFAIMALCPQHTFQVLTKRSKRMREYMAGDWSVRVYGALDGKPGSGAACGWLAGGKPLRNVWLGVSAEDQTRADERIPDLLATPAAKRFVSAEPLLGPINFQNICPEDTQFGSLTGEGWSCGNTEDCRISHPKLDWIICGGESGPGFRPMPIAWAENIMRQCKAAGTAFFFKQDSGARSGQRGIASDALWASKEFPA